MKWYAVQTYSCREKIVAQSFNAQGILHYLPLIAESHYWSDRIKIVQVPLFKGYLFIKIAPTHNDFIKVLSTRGVAKILGNHSGPVPLDHKEIESVVQLLAAGNKLEVMSGFKNGQIVKIKTGPLRNLQGTLVQMKDKKLLAIYISLLGQTVLTELSCYEFETC